MAIISKVAAITQLAEFFEATGTFDTVAGAVDAGIISAETGTGVFAVIEGGAGAPIISFADSALEIAAQQGLAATATEVSTAGITLAETTVEGASTFAPVAMGSMSLPAVASAVAPLAGFALGTNFYRENPALWTKISEKLLPFCYPGTTQIPTWAEIGQSTKTWRMLVKLGIVDAIKELFADEGVSTEETLQYRSQYGTISASSPKPSIIVGTRPHSLIEGDGYGFGVTGPGRAPGNTIYLTARFVYESTVGPIAYETYGPGWVTAGNSQTSLADRLGIPIFEGTSSEADKILCNQIDTPKIYPPTPGVQPWGGAAAPAVPETIPIIVVPEPLGPDYQPITTPTVPITPPVPALPPHTDPTHLPAPPDPETEPPPENWPDEEPWPTTIPFPWPTPETSPDPENWPKFIPWPLPVNPPEEWPTHPEPWEWPEELPWPKAPEEWPSTVPWPDSPPDPKTWPETVPWPESPEEWPDTVPWPVPWPENWPAEEPWPISWPRELPYPIPWPYPQPTPDPDPDDKPGDITDPDKQVQPYIDPIPWPEGQPEPVQPTEPTPPPSPYDDPSQPQPRPEPSPTVPDQPAPPPSSGDITPPIIPFIPLPFSSETGIISVYHPDQSTLLNFANWLWVTWHDASIQKIWNNPFDGVITLFELYCTPTDVGTKNIRSGFLDSGIPSPIISRYTEINCGSIGIPEYYGNYLDYAPYSKAYIYLPFIGVVELNVDDIVGHGVNVTYKIDEYNGSCIAMITVAKVTTVNGKQVEYNNVFYQYSGNCAVELPLAGGSQASIKAGMIEAAAWGIGSVIGGVMSGSSLGQIGAGLAYGAASAVHSLVSAKSSVQHSGSFGSSYGALGIKKPFITIVRPKQLQIANYNELYGYQAHKAVNIGSCTGYLRCREVHVISPTASDEEKSRIEELLKSGVYVTE